MPSPQNLSKKVKPAYKYETTSKSASLHIINSDIEHVIMLYWWRGGMDEYL